VIRIARPAAPPPRLDLNDADSVASKERQKIIEGLGPDGSPAAETKFVAYSDRSVRDALQDLFHNKCAYCESTIAGNQDTDIEHYRPKGRVAEAGTQGVSHPGYWWLAMDWTNLVLSCTHCNQRRRQLIIDPAMTDEQIEEAIEKDKTALAGKVDAFPTEDSVWVTTHTGDMAIEKPLLLDPTRVDPDVHLEWVLHGKYSTVAPKNGSAVGTASIRLYGLNRRRLTEDRIRKLLVLRYSGNLALQRLSEAAAATDAALVRMLETSAYDHLGAILAQAADDQPFAGLARAYMLELEREISALRGV